MVILGHFLPFSPFPLKNPKTKILKNEKNLLEISSFCTCVPKITIIWCMVPEIQSETDRFFCHFEAIFCPFTNPPPLMILKFKILKKKKKKMPGDTILLYIHVYHKWRSYDICFLKYKVRQTEISVILGHFLPVQLPDNPEKWNFKIEKSIWRCYRSAHVHHKWQSDDVWFLRYGAQQTEFFVILDRFLPFYPPMDPENQHFEKN